VLWQLYVFLRKHLALANVDFVARIFRDHVASFLLGFL
jgi:hypothetical protein